MSGLLKNTIILSNYSESQVFDSISEHYSTRLRRRTIWAEIGSDRWFLLYLRPYFKEFKIDSQIVMFHFWFQVLKLQADLTWRAQQNSKFQKPLPSYFDFCTLHGFSSKVKKDQSEREQEISIPNNLTNNHGEFTTKKVKRSKQLIKFPSQKREEVEILTNKKNRFLQEKYRSQNRNQNSKRLFTQKRNGSVSRTKRLFRNKHCQDIKKHLLSETDRELLSTGNRNNKEQLSSNLT